MSVLIGDNRETLRTLPVGCVHACVTSPPYWNLRSYLADDHPDKAKELGSEPTPEEFIANQLEVFQEVRRVLRDDGVCFVNMGDSYSANGGQRSYGSSDGATGRGPAPERAIPAMPDGNQLLMPHRFAVAMQADGWYLRDTIIWAKRSPMPSSQNGWRWVKCRVKVSGAERRFKGHDRLQGEYAEDGRSFAPGAQWADCPGCPKCEPNNGYVLRKARMRTTAAHEYVFMFAKSKEYFCDAERCKEEAASEPKMRRRESTLGKASSSGGHGQGSELVADNGFRLPRSVWTLSSEPYGKAHFATFPSALVRKCLLMALSAGGCCSACGIQYAPVVETTRTFQSGSGRSGNPINGKQDPVHGGGETGDIRRGPVQKTVIHGYRPCCKCDMPKALAVVLDPYGGSGTTAQAAQAMGHDWIICELNEAYVDHEKINTRPKWAKPKTSKLRPVPAGQGELF